MRIVHLGVGNFFRAHQAWYTQESGENWRITGVSLKRPNMRDALQNENFEYTLEISDADQSRMQIIDVLDDILVAPENPSAVIDAISDPATDLITLTVTEKGYLLDDEDISGILAGGAPSSTIGFLACGLNQRASIGTPLTILSCDNLSHNGAKTEQAVRKFAKACGFQIEEFLNNSVTFPSCMVDRITPATDDALRGRVVEAGLPSASPVATEGFSEWVIEDNFAGIRPAWDRSGAQFTKDVAPYELRKLRLLNGAHSYLAYAGILSGFEFVHEAIADPELRRNAIALMDEGAETLPVEMQAGVEAYKAELLKRFANSGLEHRLRQIAMDGSLKLAIRILATLAAREKRNLDSPKCEAAIEAWQAFASAEFAANRDLEDPASQRIKEALESGKNATEILEGNL